MMQIFPTACLLFALGSAFALPSASLSTLTKRGGACTPISYRCHPTTQTPVGEGWDVCDVSGNWVWGGACGPNQQCVFNAANGSPYCLPTIQSPCTNGATMCAAGGVQTCSGGTWSTAACPAGQTCSTNTNGVASCSSTGPCQPATYQCSPTHNGWDVCTTWKQWVNGGDCAPGQTCSFNSLNGSPYCK